MRQAVMLEDNGLLFAFEYATDAEESRRLGPKLVGEKSFTISQGQLTRLMILRVAEQRSASPG